MKTELTSIRNETEAINTDRMYTKRTGKNYYEQFYVHRFDKLDEMHQVLEIHSLPKLTQEQTI